jgi:membrane-bound lytic murein transglycosylase F
VISQYDDLIKVYSKKIDWDWTLLAALIYQESKFSPTARSWAGANGLMQLVPQTAKHYGLDTIDATAEQSLQAGTSFILDLDKYWRKHIKDKQERIKFVLASYNAGLGHVLDARKLAEKYGKNPDVWYDNVDYMILQKSNPLIYNDPVVKCGYCRGQETYNYVREILGRYGHYKTIPQPKAELAINE